MQFLDVDSGRSVPRPAIGLLDFLSLLWRRRWLLTATTLACTLLAALAVRIVKPTYTATVLVSPVTNEAGSAALGQLGSTLSQLSGALSLGGLNLSGSSSAKVVATATLQSHALAETYIEQNDLLPVLFNKLWDATQHKWKVTDPLKVPTLWIGSEFLNKSVCKVTESGRTGLVTLAVTWTDPKLAAQWANGLIALTNSYLRDRAISETQRDIAYLNEEVAVTREIELKNNIYRLMESEIQKEMMAKGSSEYALKVIDPAVAPERKSFPRPLLWVAGGALVGFSLGLAIVAFRLLLSRRPDFASATQQFEMTTERESRNSVAAADPSEIQALATRRQTPK